MFYPTRKITLILLGMAVICAPAYSQTAVNGAGKWKIVTTVSKMDDRKTVMLILDANEEVRAFPRPVRPIFLISCSSERLAVSVSTQTIVQPEYPAVASVRIRLDSDPPYAEKWTSAKGNLLVTPSADALVHQLMKSERMLFEFMPFNSTSAVAEFDVRELQKNLKPLSDAGCQLSPN